MPKASKDEDEVMLTEKWNGAPCNFLLGGFDGLHVGHKTLVERAKEDGLPIGIMTIGFDREKLFTLEERKRIFEKAGLDFCLSFSFSEIEKESPQTFLKRFSPYGVRRYYCGEDFRFGFHASAGAEELSALCETVVVPLLTSGGKKISTEEIKKSVGLGKIEEANRFLTEKFFLFGKVIKDRGIGRTIGFPTANVNYPNGKTKIGDGVYETETEVDGKTYRSITNVGARPTFDCKESITETHLLDFDGDLVGKEICVSFLRRLRGLIKFESVDGLKEQIAKDIGKVKVHD